MIQLEKLGDEIAGLALEIDAATYRLLMLLREFDECDGWAWGFHSCAEWLSWRTGMDAGAAREKVRVARALPALPLIMDALRSGELSYSKARALTRIATAENEGDLLGIARDATASHVEMVVRAWRNNDREMEARRRERRGVTLRIDADGSYVLRGRLDPEVGALLAQALEKAGGEGGGAQRTADAFGRIAEMALGAGTGAGAAERYQVVLHVDAEAMHGDDAGMSTLEDGARVSAETSRRIACDATRVIVVHGKSGQAIDIRSRARLVSPQLRRRLEDRDRGCRYPGCKSSHCDAHHVKHWADGGTTSLENLVLLCQKHHRMLHEEKYSLTATVGARRFVFVAAPR